MIFISDDAEGRNLYAERGHDCSLIALHPDDREGARPGEGGVIASGLAIGDAKDLCASKIEAMRKAAPALPLANAGPSAAAPKVKKHGGGSLR